MAKKKPPEHEFTIEDVDRMIQLVAQLPAPEGRSADEVLIRKCEGVQPGDIVLLPTRGKVVRP